MLEEQLDLVELELERELNLMPNAVKRRVQKKLRAFRKSKKQPQRQEPDAIVGGAGEEESFRAYAERMKQEEEAKQ